MRGARARASGRGCARRAAQSPQIALARAARRGAARRSRSSAQAGRSRTSATASCSAIASACCRARERGYYHEYTVPTPGVKHRGARRIVAGREGELYYTDDHYRSFRRICE